MDCPRWVNLFNVDNTLFLQTDPATSGGGGAAASKKKSLIDQFFSIEFETVYPNISGEITGWL